MGQVAALFGAERPAGTRLNWHSLKAMAADRAVLAAFGGRLWQSAAGIGTLFFVLRYFTPVLQGYFQAFLSLLALQAFVELGMLAVIVISVSHEWAGLRLDERGRIAGDPEKHARLASTFRFVAAWFALASLLLAVVGGGVGALILGQHGEVGLWLRPWIVSIILASLLLFSQSFVSMVEGANRVYQVALYRLAQGMLSSITLWGCTASGFGLWSLAAQLAVSLACTAIFLLGVNRGFFASLLSRPAASTFHWRTDIWPMQWQLALQGVAGYFSSSMLVPIIFSYHGAKEAGRMGLSLQIVLAIGSLAASWLTVALPGFGTEFASGRISEFERKWRHSSLASLLVYSAAAITVLATFVVVNQRGMWVASRFISPFGIALLLGWGLSLQFVQCSAVYWRAQRVELLGFWGLLPGFGTGLAAWLLGARFGTTGAAAGAFGVATFLMLPLCASLMLKSRRALPR